MFRSKGCWILAILFVLVGSISSSAVDRVEVESATATANTSISIGVYFENDISLYGVGFPFEFRSLTGNAYPSSITASYNPAGRMPHSGFVFPVQSLIGYDVEDGTCRGGSGGFGTEIANQPSGLTLSPSSSPDAFHFYRSAVFPPTPLPAGSDFPIGGNEPSILFDIDLSADTGSFVIDTTCTNPANHLYFIDLNAGEILPAFTPSVITVLPCSCPSQGDIDGSGAHDAVDWNLLIRVIFFNAVDPHDPECPSARCDVNNNGVSDAVDLNDLAATIWFNAGPPCDPCNRVQAYCR